MHAMGAARERACMRGAARRALKAEGYQGTPLDDLYRDEVQDFTQAELLMDLRCALRPLCQTRHPASGGYH